MGVNPHRECRADVTIGQLIPCDLGMHTHACEYGGYANTVAYSASPPLEPGSVVVHAR